MGVVRRWGGVGVGVDGGLCLCRHPTRPTPSHPIAHPPIHPYLEALEPVDGDACRARDELEEERLLLGGEGAEDFPEPGHLLVRRPPLHQVGVGLWVGWGVSIGWIHSQMCVVDKT